MSRKSSRVATSRTLLSEVIAPNVLVITYESDHEKLRLKALKKRFDTDSRLDEFNLIPVFDETKDLELQFCSATSASVLPSPWKDYFNEPVIQNKLASCKTDSEIIECIRATGVLDDHGGISKRGVLTLIDDRYRRNVGELNPPTELLASEFDCAMKHLIAAQMVMKENVSC
jgi:hypothetical protein